MLFEAGYLAPGWPVEYGGAGLSALEQVIIAEEFARAGVPTGGPTTTCSASRCSATRCSCGAPTSRRRTTCRGSSPARTRWCQGYSEPNAGSDLGSLALRATLDGDQWVLNGQKIWTSAGHLADHIFTLARTDPDAPKHKGISFLLVDMRQPGIEVRPIKMISGESEFNEVFYTDAMCPKDDVVGGVNNGWARRDDACSASSVARRRRPCRSGSRASSTGCSRWPRSAGSTEDPLIRQRLAWCYGKVQIMRYLGMRTLTQFLAGHHPGPDGAITKLYWSEYHAGRHRAGGRHPRRRGADPERAASRRSRSRPTMPARRTRRRRGSTRSSTRGPARSTPARRRSSATSSARWCSACRRSRAAGAERATCGVRARTGAVAGRPAACGRPRVRQWRRHRRRPAGGGGGRSCRVPTGDYLRFRLLTQYGEYGAAPTPPMW